jgi:hypothetical protein
MGLVQHAAAERNARKEYAEADATAQVAWIQWWNDPTDENWASHEQASTRAIVALRVLRQVEARPID